MKIIITSMVIFALWGFFSVANAQTIDEIGNYNNSDVYNVPQWDIKPARTSGYVFSYDIPHGTTGTTSYAHFWLGGTGTGAKISGVNIICNTTSHSGSNNCTGISNAGAGYDFVGALALHTISFSELNLDPANYYRFEISTYSNYNGTQIVAGGAFTDTANVFLNQPQLGGDAPPFDAPFFVLNDSSTPPEPPVFAFETRITGNYSPPIGFFDPATTTVVTLEFDYISNVPVPDTVGIQLQNIGTGFQYTPQYDDVLASGSFTFSTSTPTLSMGVYQWRAVLSGDDFAYYSPWRLFSVGTSPDQSFIPLPDDAEFGCEQDNWLANTLCSFLAWAFIPPVTTMNGVLEIWQGLRDVKPFGYVIQVIELRGSMEITDPNYTLGTLPLQTAIFDPLRAGIAVLLWVFFLFYLYNRFKSMDI